MHVPITDDDLLLLYRNGQSAAEIAAWTGYTRQRIWQRLKALNEPLKVKSAVRKCGLPGCTKWMRFHNSRLKKSKLVFCCSEHYYAYRPMLNPNYHVSRQGCRLARAEVAKHFQLEPEHIVHHVNGDQRDNRKENLVVFESQAAHMRHHHGRFTVQPLWEGKPGAAAIRLVTAETAENEAPEAVSG
jgi:hypothetical protein